MLVVQNIIDCFSFLVCSDAIETVESVINIIVSITGGICAVSGIRYILALRKKRLSAIFSFWIQLRVRIEELQRALSVDNSIINGLYSEEVRHNWNNRGSLASDTAVKRFYDNAQETLKFIKNISDQIPANEKWLDSYIEFIHFLIDISQYDIRNYSSDFKFVDSETLNHREEYCNNICNIMDMLLREIDCKQTDVAAKL